VGLETPWASYAKKGTIVRTYRALVVAVVALLLPAGAIAAGSEKLSGKYTGDFPGGIGTVKLIFDKGKLTSFVALHVEPTAKDSGCDNKSATLTMTGATQAGPGKPKIVNSTDTYVHPVGAGASVSWGNHKKSAYGDHAGLGWTENLKETTSVEMQLEVDWTFPYQGYTGDCNSGPQNAKIKLEK
jgi:hypothetical protein